MYSPFQAEVDAEVKVLLALKGDYKNQTGQDYKPAAAPAKAKTQAQAPAPTTAPAGSQVEELVAKITAQGDQVRALKSKKAEKVGYELNILSFSLLPI